MDRSLFIGICEGVALLLFSNLQPGALLLLTSFAALTSVIRERAWEIPSLENKQLLKVCLGGLLKLGVLFLALKLALGFSPMLLLIVQPAYSTINSAIALCQKNKSFNEILGTVFLLFMGSSLALTFQYGFIAMILAYLWSYLRNFQQNFSISLYKTGPKLDAYSSCLAILGSCVLIVQDFSFSVFAIDQFAYSAVLILLLEIGQRRRYIEHTFHIGYFISLIISQFPPIYGIYILVNILLLKLQSYNDREDLPLFQSSGTGLLSHICSHVDSRRILLFLILNLMFMFVEAAYGYWSNSLGLISDSIHMCFDCTALAIGLYASYISKLPPDQEHPFGYIRYEVLSGFINAVFLVFVGVNILVESIERIMSPPEINTEMLILVSVLGLLVNMVGLVFFHGISFTGENSNLQGVFLHVLADALGSVGVIVSSVLVYYWEWNISDPICSLIISGLILMSVVPLFQESIKVLLEKDIDGKSKKYVKALGEIEGVAGVNKTHVWKLNGSDYISMVWVQPTQAADIAQLTVKCKEVLSGHSSLQFVK